MKISDNKYVAVIYDLNVGEGEERELMDAVEETFLEVCLWFPAFRVKEGEEVFEHPAGSS